MFDRPGVQVMGRQEAVNRGQAEGAGLEGAFLDELAHHDLDRELGIFLAPFQQRLASIRALRLARAFVFARLAMERVKTLVAQ